LAHIVEFVSVYDVVRWRSRDDVEFVSANQSAAVSWRLIPRRSFETPPEQISVIWDLVPHVRAKRYDQSVFCRLYRTDFSD